MFQTTDWFCSIILKTVMKSLFPATFICKYKKKWSDEPIFIADRTERNVFIAVNTHYPVSCTVPNAVTSTAELYGIITVSNPLCGAAAPEWNTVGSLRC